MNVLREEVMAHMNKIMTTITIVSSLASLYILIKSQLNRYQLKQYSSKELAEKELLDRYKAEIQNKLSRLSDNELEKLINNENCDFLEIQLLDKKLSDRKKLNKISNELFRTDRYALMDKLLEKIPDNNRKLKICKMFIVLTINYLYFLSYILWIIFLFVVCALVFWVPLFLIYLSVLSLHGFITDYMDKMTSILVFSIIAILLLIFGYKENKK